MQNLSGNEKKLNNRLLFTLKNNRYLPANSKTRQKNAEPAKRPARCLDICFSWAVHLAVPRFVQARAKSFRAFSAVTASTSPGVMPLIEAISSIIYGRFSEEFRFPRKGTGERYGQSVSRSR